ncbi:amino acid permease [Corynebacterium epidermidicanis]|uniref:Amino acid/polyamine/organocation transporter, APC superfamily n=1 Tax=Corynebacterium epidermidicanis TaxID=1050174 RepID=A0A0G3GT26_9CORY|nr:amino acid permease [Corynebacterium epidermidicanis]AKK03690.1 amino acid/polyamine/organocation transporter, APC superfamily [Corynebacterium epidermidicanis]
MTVVENKTSVDIADDGLHRGMKSRHLQMISFGSAIGTGLFLGSGASIQQAGPGVLVAFAIAGFVIYLMMRMLGEMAVAHPVSGSFSTYAREYIGRRAGFITGWNWWFTTIVVGMLELTAAGTIMDFWFPDLPHWITALVTLLIVTAINLVHVGAFAEAEFWLSFIKVAALILMIVVGAAIVLGLTPEPALGVKNITEHGGMFPMGFTGVLFSLVAVIFAFGGIESIGTAAGETENPEKTLPNAINSVIWRILLFYIGGMGIIVLLAPWDQLDTATSPFVRALTTIGISGAATGLNLIVLVAALSVFNTMTFSGTRMLRDLSLGDQAPPFFAATNSRGVPVRALLFNAALMGISVLLNYLFEGKLLIIFIAIIVGAELISWTSITISHFKFRQVQRQDGVKSSYAAPFFPIANMICLAFFAMIYVLMAILPDYRTGAIALPIWILVLGVIWQGKMIHDRRQEKLSDAS